jgi:hypothetical protein
MRGVGMRAFGACERAIRFPAAAEGAHLSIAACALSSGGCLFFGDLLPRHESGFFWTSVPRALFGVQVPCSKSGCNDEVVDRWHRYTREGAGSKGCKYLRYAAVTVLVTATFVTRVSVSAIRAAGAAQSESFLEQPQPRGPARERMSRYPVDSVGFVGMLIVPDEEN